jgi:hypothetical protein
MRDALVGDALDDVVGYGLGARLFRSGYLAGVFWRGNLLGSLRRSRWLDFEMALFVRFVR